jgi:hypothetical protein
VSAEQLGLEKRGELRSQQIEETAPRASRVNGSKGLRKCGRWETEGAILRILSFFSMPSAQHENNNFSINSQ